MLEKKKKKKTIVLERSDQKNKFVFQGSYLYWNQAEIINDYSCKLVNGIVDNLGFCWIMNHELINSNEVNNIIIIRNRVHILYDLRSNLLSKRYAKKSRDSFYSMVGPKKPGPNEFGPGFTT